MIYQFSIIPAAFQELEHEIEYSKKRWGVKQANAYKKELLERINSLRSNPKLYKENPELENGLRSLRHKGNYIIYTIDEKHKTIIILGFPSVYKNNA